MCKLSIIHILLLNFAYEFDRSNKKEKRKWGSVRESDESQEYHRPEKKKTNQLVQPTNVERDLESIRDDC